MRQSGCLYQFENIKKVDGVGESACEPAPVRVEISVERAVDDWSDEALGVVVKEDRFQNGLSQRLVRRGSAPIADHIKLLAAAPAENATKEARELTWAAALQEVLRAARKSPSDIEKKRKAASWKLAIAAHF